MDGNLTNTKEPLTILNTVFNHSSFRSCQEEIIDNVLARRNTLAILPTGAGKSICFQIPALIFDGLTVVVSPLIALMKDQVDHLEKKGVPDVAYINSMLDQSKKERIYELLKNSRLKMLYVAPETFVDNKLMALLQSCNICLIAIDEVHCISIWGHNFRPDYLHLKKVIKALNNPPVLGLTATATTTVETDIPVQLGVKCDVFNDSFDRKNLLFSVLALKNNVRKEVFARDILDKLKGSVIVYVNFTKTAEELANFLRAKGLDAAFYHGKMEKETRKNVQNDFMVGQTRIVVATGAFGMGIDKEDIRAIIHFNLPKSIEDYYQEVGRAGRDGNIANCILLYSERDELKLRELIRYNTPSREQTKAVLEFLMNSKGSTIYVNVKRLSHDLGINEVPVRLMLYHLEEKDVIKTMFKIFRRAKIQLNDTDLDGRTDFERILSSGYFIADTWQDLEALSAAVGLSIQKLNWLFRDLCAAGKIELEERDICIPVEIKHGITGIDVEDIQDIFLELEYNGLKKIDRVVEYVNSQECRRKFILNYFGEEYNRMCNACDVCNPFLKTEKGAETINTSASQQEFARADTIDKCERGSEETRDKSTEIAFAIFGLIHDLDFQVGRTFLAKVLVGSKSKQILNQNLQESSYYGILKGYTAEEVIAFVDQLVDKGYLEKRQGGSRFPRPLLYLTDKAKRAIAEQETIGLELPIRTESVKDDAKTLRVFEELKNWRKEIAAARNIPPYCVFHDSTLISVANELPKAKRDLARVKGIGKKKLEAYSDAILEIVRANVEE
ncbi:MAG: ATP-dependent DNA helicase RecQ [Euryarchaeota archaeon]|nr:ATP-dependent DNA helicase RecQ [Euryarchaeota archaeon]